jgi:hypothetical protein
MSATDIAYREPERATYAERSCWSRRTADPALAQPLVDRDLVAEGDSTRGNRPGSRPTRRTGIFDVDAASSTARAGARRNRAQAGARCPDLPARRGLR